MAEMDRDLLGPNLVKVTATLMFGCYGLGVPRHLQDTSMMETGDRDLPGLELVQMIVAVVPRQSCDNLLRELHQSISASGRVG